MWSSEPRGFGTRLARRRVLGHEEIGLVGAEPSAGLLRHHVALKGRPALAAGVLERVRIHADDRLAAGRLRAGIGKDAMHAALPAFAWRDQHLVMPVQHDGGRGHRIRRLPQPRVLAIAAVERGFVAIVVEKDLLGHGVHGRLRARSLMQRHLHIVVRGDSAAETIEIDHLRRHLGLFVVQARRAFQMDDLARPIESGDLRRRLAAPGLGLPSTPGLICTIVTWPRCTAFSTRLGGISSGLRFGLPRRLLRKA